MIIFSNISTLVFSKLLLEVHNSSITQPFCSTQNLNLQSFFYYPIWSYEHTVIMSILNIFNFLPGFPLSLGDLGDLGDRKYFCQWNSEKRKWNFNGFPIFPWNRVHFIQSNSDNGNNKTNAFPILRTIFWMHFQLLWTGSLCFLRLPICLSL